MRTAERWADERGFERGHVDAGEVSLHYVAAGDADDPLVVLLHGFPEFWYAWRRQLRPLSGPFRVVAPDLRGYNLSDRPRSVHAYALDRLRGDVAGLVRAFDRESARLVGHDWGGVVAQSVAQYDPTVVERLVVMNAPYPGRFREQASLRQAARSWYAFFFQLPAAPEAVLRVRDFAFLRRALRAGTTRPDAYAEADLERYRAAWVRPGAPAAMVNYYRALGRRTLAEFASARRGRRGRRWQGESRQGDRRVRAPTALLWGERDRALGAGVREFLEGRLAPGTVRRYPGASHWLHAEFPEEVTGDLLAFL